MEALFDEGVLKGITFHWKFDAMFSSMILTDYKPDTDGQYGATGISAIKANAFDNLENYHYFLALFLGDKPLPKFRIEKFTPSVIDEKRLVYSFFVPLNLKVLPKNQTVRVTVYDDSYYVAFEPMKAQDLVVRSGLKVSVTASTEKTKVKPLWPGQYMPDQLVIRYVSN
jgi:ABC-type uncharacterized transport system substrate-binding protein